MGSEGERRLVTRSWRDLIDIQIKVEGGELSVPPADEEQHYGGEVALKSVCLHATSRGGYTTHHMPINIQ